MNRRRECGAREYDNEEEEEEDDDYAGGRTRR